MNLGKEKIKQLLSSLSLDISRFQTEKIIGKGSYSEVYLAIDKLTGNKVVLKQLNFDMGESAEDKNLLIVREILAMVSVSHPFLLKIIGYSKTNPFTLVIPYIQHGSLYRFIHSEKWSVYLDSTRRTIIMMAISHAMSVLHANGIIHRDLKSMNVLLDQRLYPVVCDFGISRFMDETKSLTVQVGTPHWMAPELLAGKKNYDKSIDVYSYGMLLYEMITNSVPFAELELCDVIKMVCTEQRIPELPEESQKRETRLVELYKNCSSFDPSQRPSFSQIYQMFKNHIVYFEGTNFDDIDKLSRKLDKYEKKNHIELSLENTYIEDSEFEPEETYNTVFVQEEVAPTSTPANSAHINNEPLEMKNLRDPNQRKSEIIRSIFSLRSSQYLAFLNEIQPEISSDEETLHVILELLKKPKFLDAFLESKSYKKLPLQSNCSMQILMILFQQKPEKMTDFSHEMKIIAKQKPTIALGLLFFFARAAKKVDDPWPMLDLLIHKSKYFLSIEKSDIYITLLFKLLKDKNYRAARLQYIAPIWAKCVSMVDHEKACSLSYDCLAFFDSSIEIPTNHLLQGLRINTIQSHVILYITRSSMSFDNKVAKELLTLSLHNASATFALIKMASSDATFFVSDMKWLENDLPSIAETYRLLIAVCSDKSLRETISLSNYVAPFLYRNLSEKQKIAEVCSTIRCLPAHSQFIMSLSTNNVLKTLFSYLCDGLNENQVEAIVKCVIHIVPSIYVDDYAVLPSKFAQLLKEKSEATSEIITALCVLVKHSELHSSLISLKLDRYFRKLLALDSYHDEAVSFLKDIGPSLEHK